MNRKLFLNRFPSYWQDPSFSAEKVAGVVPNVYQQTITENGNYQQNGNFTGVDITVNVPGSGSVPNVYQQTITENGIYQQNGNFTGVDITVNVPGSGSVPICDRVCVGETVVMLSQFSVASNVPVTIPSGHVLVVIGYTDFGPRFLFFFQRMDDIQTQWDIIEGDLYHLFEFQSGHGEPDAWFSDANGDLLSLFGQGNSGPNQAFQYIYPNVMTFSR